MNIYDSYRYSGIAWIGEIPSHWERNRIKFLLSYHSDGIWGDEEKGNANDIPCIRIADFIYDRMTISNVDLTLRNFSDEELEGREIKKGDLLIEKSGGGEATPVGRVVIANNDTTATCSNFIHFIRIKSEYNNTFLCYYFNALYANKINLLYFNQTTGIQNLQIPKYLAQQIFLPPNKEQEAIADYLDRKCASIDGIIAIQERRIALLNELKQSVITEAVTRGINPDAPLRDSGIDWIGQIPAHWEVKPLKYLVSCNDESLPSSTPEETLINYVEIGDVQAYYGITNYTEYTFGEAPSRARRITKKDDVIVSTVRTYLRAISKIDSDDLIVSTGFAVLRARKVSPSFLSYLSYAEYFIQSVIADSKGVSYPSITSYELLQLKIAVPSIEEQLKIVNYLKNKISPLDSAMAKAKREIELLREYKQSVITEAVTGKIKVC